MKIRPIILSGGSGTRLWPLSRRSFPKQFAPLVGDESLFAAVLRLTRDRSLFEAPLVVGNRDHKFLILDALDSAGIKDARILLEPEGRNTAPAVITAALDEKTTDVLHLVLPSDHVITDGNAFLNVMRCAAPAAQAGHIILFGMTPSHPETGYGYITCADPAPWEGVFHIGLFQEKPDAVKAQQLIEAKALWNSGIFLYAPVRLLEEVTALAPDYMPLCKTALELSEHDLGCIMLAADPYAHLKPAAFDTLIMERTKHGCVVPCSIGWSDVGSWQALWQMSARDSHDNSLNGPVVTHDVSGAFIRSDGPTVAVLGMKDVTVIATGDAVLIAPRDRAQDVKSLFDAVERHNPEIARHHARVLRPWGSYQGLAQGAHFQVKHIVVQPGRSLSLQKHNHRAEHWVVVGGTAKVECNNVEKLVYPNESVYIARGTVHRLSNPGKIPLNLIEVQSGDYLGEDDIIRFDDQYGRATKTVA
jgi:mannose-1-phosphate guanylyltransferase/mannose-6-phosphate isomerase